MNLTNVGTSTLEIFGGKGSLALTNLTTAATLNIHIFGGDLNITAGCTAGIINIFGYIGKLTNNTGGTTVNIIRDDSIDAILIDTAATLIDTNEIQGKLPDNNIMGSSVTTDKDDEIDAIKVQTDLLPADPASETNVNANETKIDLLQVDSTAILGDTNEMQGKLPTNNIMGSSVKTDKDDEIDAIKTSTDAILVDTGTTLDTKINDLQGAGFVTGTDSNEAIRNRGDAAWATGGGGGDATEAKQDTILANLATVDTVVDTILVDTNEIQGKLPTNNIMGSAVKTDKDDEIDAIKTSTDAILVDTSTTLDTKLNNLQTDSTAILADTNETQGKLPTNNIMGSSVKTDKDDEIDAIKTSTDAILVDTGTTLDTKINDIQGATFSSVTDSLESIRDRGDAAWTTGAGGDATEAKQDTILANLATVDGVVDDILVDTNETQGKLPTNNIMGSSVKTDKDDEIDAVKAKTDNLPGDP